MNIVRDGVEFTLTKEERFQAYKEEKESILKESLLGYIEENSSLLSRNMIETRKSMLDEMFLHLDKVHDPFCSTEKESFFETMQYMEKLFIQRLVIPMKKTVMVSDTKNMLLENMKEGIIYICKNDCFCDYYGVCVYKNNLYNLGIDNFNEFFNFYICSNEFFENLEVCKFNIPGLKKMIGNHVDVFQEEGITELKSMLDCYLLHNGLLTLASTLTLNEERLSFYEFKKKVGLES